MGGLKRRDVIFISFLCGKCFSLANDTNYMNHSHFRLTGFYGTPLVIMDEMKYIC